MKLPEQVSSAFKKYPFKERVPRVVSGILCGLMGLLQNLKRVTGVDEIIIAALVFMFFCGPRGRPFWFFAGIVIGGLLIQALPKLHSIFVH
jgi:hypothetical protein